MDDRDKILYHQIHPLKLLTDGMSEALSLPLFWQHRLRPGLVLHFAPPILASFALIRRADLEAQRRPTLGRYIAQSMTPQMQAVRFLGDLIMVAGAWRRRPLVIFLGAGVVIFGWLRGRILPPP